MRVPALPIKLFLILIPGTIFIFILRRQCFMWNYSVDPLVDQGLPGFRGWIPTEAWECMSHSIGRGFEKMAVMITKQCSQWLPCVSVWPAVFLRPWVCEDEQWALCLPDGALVHHGNASSSIIIPFIDMALFMVRGKLNMIYIAFIT